MNRPLSTHKLGTNYPTMKLITILKGVPSDHFPGFCRNLTMTMYGRLCVPFLGPTPTNQAACLPTWLPMQRWKTITLASVDANTPTTEISSPVPMYCYVPPGFLQKTVCTSMSDHFGVEFFPFRVVQRPSNIGQWKNEGLYYSVSSILTLHICFWPSRGISNGTFKAGQLVKGDISKFKQGDFWFSLCQHAAWWPTIG